MNCPLKDHTTSILQYANHLHDENGWLDEVDRIELQILANRIEKLSDEVQERIDASEELRRER